VKTHIYQPLRATAPLGTLRRLKPDEFGPNIALHLLPTMMHDNVCKPEEPS
jgi:hypothetical protein